MTSSDPAPGLLTSLASAAIHDGRGDLTLVRETRGAPVEWGGVYAQLVRLTGPWEIRLAIGEHLLGLPEGIERSEATPERFRSHHRVGPLLVDQEVAALAEPPGVVRSLRFANPGAAAVPLTVISAFEPFLFPVLVEGIRPTRFRVSTAEDGVTIRQRGFALQAHATVLPSHLYLDIGSWRGGHYDGRVRRFASTHDLEVPAGGTGEVRLLLRGGLGRDLDRFGAEAALALDDPEPRVASTASDREAWVRNAPTLRFPDAPWLDVAYAQARDALRRLYTAPGDGLTGLVAGFPWYSAIWCRDVAWMLPAVLWLGDVGWAERSIDSVLRYQARRDLAILGGEAGELPMQVAPGPVLLYGTSDTTLYYPALVDRWLRHGGDPNAARAWSDPLTRAIAWGARRTAPETGLIRNGGEVEEMSAAAGAVARVRYGIDAPDTTIWDSADRRDHAVDLQVLWWQALRAAEALGLPASVGGAGPGAAADRLAGTLARRYAWPEQEFLVDSLRSGAPVHRVRPNALRAVSAGLVSGDAALAAVRRAAQPDLTTPWGVRTLSASDPEYDPGAYHMGQVWSIATAWAADAAFAVGAVDLGVGYLRTLADRYASEGGFANECYRGDQPTPYDSCFLLGFSVGPFLTVLFERLWGLAVDARRPALRVEPGFPNGWRTAHLESLAVGAGRADLTYQDGVVSVRWHGAAPLAVTRGGRSTEVPPGGSAAILAPAPAPAAAREPETS